MGWFSKNSDEEYEEPPTAEEIVSEILFEDVEKKMEFKTNKKIKKLMEDVRQRMAILDMKHVGAYQED